MADEAPGLAVPDANSGHDSEVASRDRRLQHTNADERRIFQAAERCTKSGSIDALMRHEDAYSPSLITWRRQWEVADLAAMATVKRAPNAEPKRAVTSHMTLLTRERNGFKSRLARASDRLRQAAVMAVALNPHRCPTLHGSIHRHRRKPHRKQADPGRPVHDIRCSKVIDTFRLVDLRHVARCWVDVLTGEMRCKDQVMLCDGDETDVAVMWPDCTSFEGADKCGSPFFRRI
ncbi:hypothetical protein F3K02_05680 [Hydrogenophaga sp. D2P1]|uniref:Transposase n=1 Tax=Hydrogenophaga aromaticivorans TaxID=2610898 RepID=A0A7Y8KX79_9BURK|nr:hypothetical protein [Hydrogenophaga aromaticivorans]NWF44743.1 hypothetical protein [Hydrogenophaga aromaticivorans]